MDKKKPFSFLLARWRGLVQACAALLTNLHLPNFLKGTLYRGAGKTVCEGIRATITLPSPAAKTRCWALDESGARKAAVPVRDAGGRAEVALDPAYRTVWYELDVR